MVSADKGFRLRQAVHFVLRGWLFLMQEIKAQARKEFAEQTAGWE